MTFAETVAYFTFLVQVATNVAVVFWVFPLWRKRKLPFFAVLGFSALLGVFSAVANWTLGHNPMSKDQYYWFWSAFMILGAIDLILYAVGIFLMVQHFQSAPPPERTAINSESERND